MIDIFKNIVLISTILLSTVIAVDNPDRVDILKVGSYSWDGYNKGSEKLEVTAEGHYISVTIETCDIGKKETRPNEDYLILRQGNDDGISTEVGKRFAYITKSKKLYFYSSSVILELKVSNDSLTVPCKVTFEKAGEEDSTLPPVTTTELIPTAGPLVSKYATIFISGKQIEDFEKDKKLLESVKESLFKMAVDYTKINGFCLSENITIKNVEIYTLEQCPMKWPDYQTCVRLVYSLPVKMKEKCELWKGYQLTEANLDKMWNRMANQYLPSIFHVYREPDIQNAVTWWTIILVFIIILFCLLLIVINVIWKKREIMMSRKQHGFNEFIEARRGSDDSMTIPEFQTPPMFGELHPIEPRGNDNEGFDNDDELLHYQRIKSD
ncbi:hypothetical protein WA026_013492 [Henosepilachna vigintioctopunctata]|uniref:Uncharacterized protein n=1 Tax=Henosepilachna vigintioctopunctata TaxID=420089 RepID=A0AAW1V651_9CUCU